MAQQDNQVLEFLIARNQTDVLQIFRAFRPDINPELAIRGEAGVVFPVEVLDRYFETRPQIGEELEQLFIQGFDPANTEQLIEFICTRFPNLHNLHFDKTEMLGVENLLTQMARLPLFRVELAIRQRELDLALVPRFMTRFPLLIELSLQCFYDDVNLFFGFFGQIFPDVAELSIVCNVRFRDEFLENVPRVFRLLRLLNMVVIRENNGEPTLEVHNFPRE